ncbi:MAG: hypothetical protein II180_00660, partial [Proteobacteria bacterium]|nr:hypothetical protein [Pseudomonadota bacterium]
CKCHGKDIHLGDVCTKEGVVCGADSNTTGCLCGETPLKEGYRCLQKEQICACGSQIEERDDSDEEEIDEEEIGEEEIDEEDEKTVDSDETDTKGTPCTCQCGDKVIESGVACDPAHPPIEIDKSKCGNLGAFYENVEEKHIKYNGQIYKVDESIPEMAWLACTCGTGLEAPGEGYVCAFKSDVKGYADVHMDIVVYAGWICTKMEGCACGENICDPGALCVTDKDGGKSCSEFNNIDRTCKELSEAYAYENGYKCYYNESEYAKGWYCDDVEGCACGEVTCEQYQMCLAPGYCSKNKLTSESEQQMLNRPRPIIKLCKEDDDYGNAPDCEYAEQSGIQVTPWVSETPNPLLHYVPESSAYLAVTRRKADGQSKEITTLFEGFLNLIEDGMDIASYMPNNYDPNNAALNLSDWGIEPTGKADAALYAHRGYVVMHVTVNDEKKAEKQVEAWLKMLRTALTQKSRQLGKPCMKYFDDGSCRFWAMTAHAGNSVMQLRNEFTKWKQLYLGYHVGEGVLTLIIFDKKMWDGVYLPRDKFTRLTEDILLAVKTTYDETSDPLADQITKDVLWVQRKPYQPTEADYHGAMIYRIGQKQTENAVFVLPIDDKAIDEAYIKSHFMTE